MTIRSTYEVKPGRNDPIRIVPLALEDEILRPSTEAAKAPAAAPELTYRGGPLLTSVEVATIFWGSAWTSSQAPVVKQVNDFFDSILSSALLDQLSEYSVAGKPIGRGRRTASVTIGSPGPSASVTDAAIRVFLQHQLATNAGVPPAGPNSLYFLFLPSGVTVVQGGSKSCQAFCGYHDAIGNQIFYAVMPYPGCKGCQSSLTLFEALTTASSHELCEAITDPIPGDGWYDDSNGEIGDICAWKTKKLGAYTVQLEWSNAKGKCV
ncbi:MAG TPA: hypothetical protein VF376_01535 [Thermoanaerobaculia bacterium]